LFLLAGCNDVFEGNYMIRIKNHSDQTIALYADYILPDTLLPATKPKMKEATPGKQIELYDGDVNDPKFKRFENDKLTFFVLSQDTVVKYPWDTLTKYYNILKRFELNHQDLINIGGDIIYE